MAEEKKDIKIHGTAPLVIGKKWAGEKFSTVVSLAEVEAVRELNKKYEHENAVPLSVYFQIRRISDPVTQSMMSVYTKVQKATLVAFDEIFSTF